MPFVPILFLGDWHVFCVLFSYSCFMLFVITRQWDGATSDRLIEVHTPADEDNCEYITTSLTAEARSARRHWRPMFTYQISTYRRI